MMAGGQNLRMKICFNSSQFFACSGDILSNHLLATPSRVRGNMCKRAESFALNKLATSSTFPICSIAFSFELPDKVIEAVTGCAPSSLVIPKDFGSLVACCASLCNSATTGVEADGWLGFESMAELDSFFLLSGR
ncbi:hypothetical protein Tco_0823961 [Tanacetum coccineum]|uniref:Uncharacterized protein n=1 Tax=Tanacetum coccineum TaxID=301880 RepID=A0ABQ5AM29_9ASTR